jgi:hypothetical protein
MRSKDASTTLQRIAAELVDVLAEDIRVLNDQASDGGRGGGDVDCAVRGVHSQWPLRLREWQLGQAFWYDVTATYYVFVRGEETIAVDVLDDPLGIGRYGFAASVFAVDADSGSLAAAPDRAAYLTLKRIVKGRADESSWDEVKTLAGEDWDRYRAKLAETLGNNLADDIATSVAHGGTLGEATLTHWRSQFRRGRLIRPKKPLLWGRLALARIAYRLRHPTGLVVAIVGPDGAGKSSVAEALPSTCGPLFRRSLRIHFRPGLLPRPGAVVGKTTHDVSQPHARVPHGRALSLALLTYYWLDVLLGHFFRVAPARVRTTLVVVERGFLDIAVDPTRYRLRVSPGIVRAFARLLPTPDLTVVLEARADAIAARKVELPTDEIVRQSEQWRVLAPRSKSVWVDTSNTRSAVLAEVRGHILERLHERALARVCGGWAAVPSARRPRLYLPQRPAIAALGGLRLEAPSKPSSRLGLNVARAAVACGALRAFPTTSPPTLVRKALAPHVPAGCTIAVKRSIHPYRFLAVILNVSGAPIALAKVATNEHGRSRLRAEEAAIKQRATLLSPPLRGPRVLAYDEDVLVLDWVPHTLRRQPWFLPPEVAFGLGSLFAAGKGDGEGTTRGPAHGDAAPWNLLRVGDEWVLVDWELSSAESPAFFDVLHYLVQSHLLLGRPRRGELMRGISGDDWVGEAIAAYATGAGLPFALAAESFEAYDEYTSAVLTRRDMNARSMRRWHELKAAVTQ